MTPVWPKTRGGRDFILWSLRTWPLLWFLLQLENKVKLNYFNWRRKINNYQSIYIDYSIFILYCSRCTIWHQRDGAVSPASSPKLTKAKGTSLSRDTQIFLSPALFGDLITFKASWEAWSPTYPGCLLQSPSSSDQSWSDTWTISAGSFRCEGVPPRW